MSEPKFTSPLAHRADRTGAQGLCIGLKEISDRGMIDLRGRGSDAAFLAAVERVLGVALPTVPRTSAAAGGIGALWFSIDQWLITCPRGDAADLARKLTAALAGIHSLVCDVSDARAIIRLEGDCVRGVISKGTSVDYTDGSYPAGSVRRLRYAEVAAAAHVVSGSPDVVDLYVFRSYADYVWEYVLKTAKEPATLKLFGKQPVAAV